MFPREQIGWSPTAVYTVAFFSIWGVIAAAAALTGLLEVAAEDLNRGQWPEPH